jgi:hypothetical protein
MTSRDLLDFLVQRTAKAKPEAHRILSQHERSASRVVIREGLLRRLSGLPIDVQDRYSEAVSCLERGLRRGAIVMAWAGHFHVYGGAASKPMRNGVRVARPKWFFRDATDKENVVEAQILDVGKDVGFIGKPRLKVLQGRLATRNQRTRSISQCQSMNTAIGHIYDMLRQTISYFSP